MRRPLAGHDVRGHPFAVRDQLVDDPLQCEEFRGRDHQPRQREPPATEHHDAAEPDREWGRRKFPHQRVLDVVGDMAGHPHRDVRPVRLRGDAVLAGQARGREPAPFGTHGCVDVGVEQQLHGLDHRE
ncbi:hypothetical protein H849_12935 [Prescottella equi NBRC 101255 = C 7]|nr:hypothetical protein H849_12935 [Prescottella equi NBRC 101255 = C 7]